MFPLHDDNPTLRPPLIAITLVMANIAVWVVVQGLGTHPALLQSVTNYGLIPGELLGRIPAGTQFPLGDGAALVITEPNWITLLTHMFLHGSWFHLIGNVWFLWVFGDNVEDVMGRVRFLVFYLLCGFAAAGAQMIADPSSHLPMVGASGAVSGVMGAYAVLYPRARVHVIVLLVIFLQRIIVPAWMMLGYWVLLQLVGAIPTVSGTTGGVAFWAHLGGFGTGIVLVLFFRDSKRVRRHHALMQRRGLPE